MDSRRGSPQRACEKLGRMKAMVPAGGGAIIVIVLDGSGSGLGAERGPRT